MVLYPNKLPESERVCSGICKYNIPIFYHRFTAIKTKTVKSLKSGNDEE